MKNWASTDPNRGPPTLIEKLNMPVNSANILASILLGVSWLKRISVGRSEKQSPNVSDMKLLIIT